MFAEKPKTRAELVKDAEAAAAEGRRGLLADLYAAGVMFEALLADVAETHTKANPGVADLARRMAEDLPGKLATIKALGERRP